MNIYGAYFDLYNKNAVDFFQRYQHWKKEKNSTLDK